ncbi:hypothetical protein [Limnovirga soli]|uniref:Uncharacterized protein n=1 Tax=Limnovirga soli TaxID=2656915 RepID=A0A8J8JSU5_9BACT|nr:hypothetical protein [Limnovirga soli]NNV57377.1 hypothetical protein [Limnovirga soli]
MDKESVHKLINHDGITVVYRKKPPVFTAQINTSTFALTNILFLEPIEEGKKEALYKKAIAFTKHYLRTHNDNKRSL